jgi:hypothetical protein
LEESAKMIYGINILNIFSKFSIDWLIYLSLFMVLCIQIWLIFKSKNLTKQRFRVRLGLNLLLWLIVLLFVIQPQWKFSANTNRVLFVSENIPASTIQKAKDSLKITETFSTKELTKFIAEKPNFVKHLGTIFLLGEDFSPEILSHFGQKNTHFLPYFGPNEIQIIKWKGIVRKSEMQEIVGKIAVSEEKTLKVKYADQILDSLTLKTGINNFKLRFPIFSVGRTETEMFLGEKPLQKINFFSIKNPPINVQFILANPDFESKSLAEWLGKNGNRVETTTLVAKNAQSQTSINKSKQKFVADIVITDAQNASHVVVKKAIADGKSVLFLGLINPEQELKSINYALGTQFFAKKISNEESIKIIEDLTTLPYKFTEKSNQRILTDFPIAIQRTSGRVGVSLLNETFPLKLSGDSLTYAKIWTSVFQQINPAFFDNITIDSPIFQDLKTSIVQNNNSGKADNLKISSDTIVIEKSAVNGLTSNTSFTFRKSGWQSLHDTLDIFVEQKPSKLMRNKQIQEFLQINSNKEGITETNQTLTAKLPDWAWFLLILLSFTAVWVEPKLRF